MLECMKEMKGKQHDFISFWCEENDKMIIQSSEYKEAGEKVGGSELGDEYHIVLTREMSDGNLSDISNFDAVLIDPLEYLSQLIPCGWSGFLARKTTTSGKLVEETLAIMNKNLYTESS